MSQQPKDKPITAQPCPCVVINTKENNTDNKICVSVVVLSTHIILEIVPAFSVFMSCCRLCCYPAVQRLQKLHSHGDGNKVSGAISLMK